MEASPGKATTGRFWNEPVETLDPEALWQLEEERLRWQIRWVWERSPFYREKLQAAGFDAGAVGRADLPRLPFTTKEEVRRSQEATPPLGAHSCVPFDQVVRVHASSGTTGRPTLVGATANDVAMWRELVARCMWAQGVRPGTRAWVALSMGWWIAGLSFYEGLQHMGASVLPAGNTELPRTFAVLAQTGVDYMISTPSFAMYLARYAQEKLGLDPARVGVRHMGLGGEPGAGMPEVRRLLEEMWGCKVYDCMGTADFCTVIWSECEAQAGMHFLGQGLIIPELVNPVTGHPIDPTPGATGELVYTAIQRECVPLLRFRIGDVVRIEGTGRCDCGRTGWRIRCVGRVDDMLIVQGVNVYPSAVADVISGFRPRTTGEIQILVPGTGPQVTPPVRIRVEHSEAPGELDQLHQDLETALRERLLFRARVELVPPGTLAPQGSMKRQLVLREPAGG